VRKADNLATFMCRLSENSRNLSFQETYGTIRGLLCRFTTLWLVATYCLVQIYICFAETYCLHPQRKRLFKGCNLLHCYIELYLIRQHSVIIKYKQRKCTFRNKYFNFLSFNFLMFSTCFQPNGSSSRRRLCMQVWYSVFYILHYKLFCR
jgi:hypothetical protein